MDRDKVIKAFEDIIKEETYPDRPRRFMMPLELAEQVLALLKEQESKPDKCIICEGCGHKLQDNWNLCPWCGWETKRGRRYGF